MLQITVGEKTQTLSDIIASLTPWFMAILVFIVVIVFRKEIKSLLARLLKVKALGAEMNLEAEKAVATVEAKTDAGLSVQSPTGPLDIGSTHPVDDSPSKDTLELKIDTLNPRTTIIQDKLNSFINNSKASNFASWLDHAKLRGSALQYGNAMILFNQLNNSIEKLFSIVFPEIKDENYPSMAKVFNLGSNGTINKSLQDAILGILTIQKSMIGGDYSAKFSDNQILRSVATAERLRSALDEIIATKTLTSAIHIAP